MDNQYWITTGGYKSGPYVISQLRSMWHSGMINANTLYWQEGFHGWVSLSNIIHLLEPHQPAAPPPLPTEPQNLHTPPPLPTLVPPPLPTLVNASQGIKCDSNVNHPRKITKDTLHDDTLLGISSDMPTEEIRTHLNKLFRKYSGRISHDDPRIAAKARERLKKIGEARARHIGIY
ncbi:GYF domain-containing protein [bacterium]|nr:GYF domain-containing protein [bacterium]